MINDGGGVKKPVSNVSITDTNRLIMIIELGKIIVRCSTMPTKVYFVHAIANNFCFIACPCIFRIIIIIEVFGSCALIKALVPYGC